MRFKEKTDRRKTPLKSKLMLIFSLALFACGAYLLVLLLTPYVPVFYPQQVQSKNLGEPKGDRIIIPKVGINVEYKTGGEEVLDDYAWHRFPERGDPVNGGNFIISAHRFEIGLTPSEVRRRSPFYHIEKLAVGDQVLIDHKGVRYGYEVVEKKQVQPTQVEIEAPSDEPKLTIYTCTLGGASDGREVFIAKPLGRLVAEEG